MPSSHKSPPHYLSAYSKEQQQVICGPWSYKEVIAGAGSGKTHTLMGLIRYRLSEGLEQASRVLLLSFSRKAVQELRARLPSGISDGLYISTFHAFCYRSLAYIYPRKFSNIKILADDIKEKILFDFLTRPETLSVIGGVPISLLCNEPYYLKKYFYELHLEYLEELNLYKSKNRCYEFEEIVDWTLHSLRGWNRNKRAIALKNSYDLIIVDEFQDTDPRQLDFLKQMHVKRCVVVGDDWQAIYGFRGACVDSFLRFEEHYKKKGSHKRLYLSTNYRSLEHITRLGSKIIRASSLQIPKQVRTIRSTAIDLPVLSLELEDDAISLLARKLKAYASVDFMVLVRTNNQRQYWIERGLSKKKVMTIHQSKGLEFSVVFLDLCLGWTTKSKKKQKQAELDEEIRLLYVASSRPMNLLIILHYNLEEAERQEAYYCRRLILPYTAACTLDAIDDWFAKEATLLKAG